MTTLRTRNKRRKRAHRREILAAAFDYHEQRIRRLYASGKTRQEVGRIILNSAYMSRRRKRSKELSR